MPPESASAMESLSPELELFFPSPPDTPPPSSDRSPAAPRLRRGPMYSAYSELRDISLRRKNHASITPWRFTEEEKQEDAPHIPPAARLSVSSFSSTALRKENREPPGFPFLSPAAAKVGKLQCTPPRPPPATAPRTAGAASSSPGQGRRKDDSGSRRSFSTGPLAARRSFSCLKELKELKGVSGAAAAKANEGRGRAGAISMPPPQARWY